MPKKYMHNQPGLGPNKVPPSWRDRDEDKVSARAMLASVLLTCGRRSSTWCSESALCCAEKKAKVLAWGQNSARVWTQVAAALLLLPCILPPPSSRTRACFFSAPRVSHSPQTAHAHTRKHTTGSAVYALRW